MTKRAGSQGGMIPKSGFVLGREMFLPETTLQSRRDSEGSRSEAFFSLPVSGLPGVFTLSSLLSTQVM